MALENYKIEDLFNKVKPALNAKVCELKRCNITNISEVMLWNYLAKNVWVNKKDLRLYNLVDDILNIDELEIIEMSKK